MAYEIKKNGNPILHQGKKILALDMAQVVKSVNMDARTMTMIGSTEARDRDGDRIMVEGWDLKHYVKNPVFLWAHDYSSVPLAATGKVVKRKSPEPHLDFQDIRYPKAGIFPFADMILELYKEKIINASSVGFLPYEWEEDEVEKNEPGIMYRPMLYKKQQLLELSGCAVPSNPEALQNSMKSVMKKHFGDWKDQDLVKAMVEGAVPTDHQYDDLMNELNIKQIEVEEETKIQVQVPVKITTQPTIKEMKRWNPSLPKVFDVDQEEFKPASETLELYSKYLDSKIKNIVRRDIVAYGPMVSGYLAAIKTWVEDNFETKDVCNFSRGGEIPPEYDDIQLTSVKSEEFLVEGTQFLAKDKDIGVVLNTYPIWGGIGFTVFASDEQKSWINSEIKNIHKWVEDNPFLKGEKFALSGKFIDKTEETMEDVVLDTNIRKSLNISLKIASGGKDSRGIMLVGPPGTGKTMLGKAIKNETNSTFIWISAKDFSRIGATGGLSFAFDLARKLAPTVLFVEDIDGWANGRAVDILKGEMDGLRTMKGVLTILTSNNPTTFPRSLIDRPGRFHDVIVFDNPDRENRGKMIIKWSNGQKISEDVMKILLDQTEGFSGAHIRDLINFAQAIADGEEKDFEDALKESLNKILAQRELIQTLPNYDTLGKSNEISSSNQFHNDLKESLGQKISLKEVTDGPYILKEVKSGTLAEAEGVQTEDVLDHVMTADTLPSPAPKKGLNPQSVKELSDTLGKLKTVLNSF